MGMITIFEETTKEPITLIGKMSGVCYNSPIDDREKNYKRGLHNINSGHGRTLEFPDIYMIIDGYSARVIRELYTHIGGAPTRVQASTRYIDYAGKGFNYITPPKIDNSWPAAAIYRDTMHNIKEDLQALEEMGFTNEDIANLLPLGMTTKMVYRINLRTLIDMSYQRLCSCAYWEFRKLMNDILKALAEYSEEWNTIINDLHLFKPKCEVCGYCNETNRTCGRRPLKEEFDNWYNKFLKDWKESKNYQM